MKGDNMEEKVIIKAFSGGKEISSREINLHDYYEELHPEIDNGEYIKNNSIDLVEQHFYDENSYFMTKNYYQEGELLKSEKLENGKLEVEYVK